VVTFAAAGAVPSNGPPLYDLTFSTSVPNGFVRNGAQTGATCATPPLLPLGLRGTTATRCIF
jgi:hypothetical protein